MKRFFYTLAFLLFASAGVRADAPVWSYDGDQNGQDQWHYLSPAYTICESGTQQSPVHIAYTTPSPLPVLHFNYNTAIADIAFANHALELRVSDGMTLTEGKNIYHLKKIQFHSPAEHRTNASAFFLAEMQFYHEDKNGKLLILSVLAERGKELDGLQAVLDKIKDQKTIGGQAVINPALLLPVDHSYYAYTGSITYPPCTEGVEWRVLKSSVSISQAQLEIIAKTVGRNARLPQPVYMREIKESN